MTEQVKESLSAWLDGEASEIEIHRLVRHYTADAAANGAAEDRSGSPETSESSVSESLRASGLRYQHMRTVLRREHGNIGLSHEIHMSLHASISAAIADEPAHSTGSVSVLGAAKPRPMWIKPVGGLAAAASLVLAVFVGTQLDLQPAVGTDSTANSTTSLASRQSVPVDVQTVSTQGSGMSTRTGAGNSFSSDAGYAPAEIYADASDANFEQTELKTLDEAKQRQLRAYLRQHDQMTRLNPNARTVIFTPPSQP